MYAIVAFIAFSCLASPAAGRRNSGNLAAKLGSNFEPSVEIAKAEATVEAVVENVDEGLNAAPKAEAQTWATVSTVDQVGPSLDDIVPKTAVNYVISTEGAAPSDPEGEYWLEANLSAVDGASCDAFKSKVDRLLQAVDSVTGPVKISQMFSLSCWHEKLTLLSVHRVLAPHEVHAVKMFATHLKHINVTESTMMDAATVLKDKNKPILEEMFQGFRVEMDVVLTKALEKVISEKILQLTGHANPLIYEGPLRGSCSLGELPCPYSWQGHCCSTSSCLHPLEPGSEYPRYQDDMCLFNRTSCWEYCKEKIEMQQQKTQDIVENVVAMFKGASSDMRLSYDDAKRRELFQSIPFLNASFNDIVAKMSVPWDYMKLSVNGSTHPWLGPLADVLEAANDLDTLDSVAIKNLPGVKAQVTFTNVHPFKVAGSMLQDLGVIKFLRESGETAPTAPAPAPAPNQVRSWRDAVEFMPATEVGVAPTAAAPTPAPKQMHSWRNAVEFNVEIAKAEATVEAVVENVDEGLNAAPKAEAQTWATVSTVDQVGPSLDDIVPKTAVNYVISTEGAAPSDPEGEYWLEANLSAVDGASCDAFKSKVDRLLQAVDSVTGPVKISQMFSLSCWHEKLTLLSVHRVLAPHEVHAVKMFATHLKHINVTESTMMDAATVLKDKNKPILEEMFQGFRVEMDVVLTKALEKVISEKILQLTGHANPLIYEGPLRGSCSLGELPCPYSWQGHCCSTSSCLHPLEPGSEYPRYQDDMCLFNRTSCWEYCKEKIEMQQQKTKDIVENAVAMFKGASSDMRLSYDDAKRRELFQSIPFLNASFNDIVAKLSVPWDYMKLSVNGSTHPWLGPLADVLEAANDLDTLDSVAIKNLPGVKAQVTFTNVHPFKVAGSMLQDLGVIKFLRESGETAPTAPAPAPAPKHMHSWRNQVEFMPATEVEAVQEVEAAVANRVLKAEAAGEHAMESLERELPPTPTKLIPLKATISMGPSLGHFDTHENVSYMLFHESKAAVDPSLSLQIEVNVTAASAEAAASFAELCNTLVKKLNTGPFLEVHSYGSLVTVLSMPLPGDTANLKQELTMIMKHIGHLTWTVSANNNIEHMMAHPDDSIWNQAKTGAKIMLDATLTDAVEKALVEQMKQRSHHEVECATMEAPCVDVDHPDSCCSLAACVAPDDGEESGPNWQEIQCKYNETCAPLCGGSGVAKTPRDYVLAMSEKLMQIFTGGSVDVRVAYDDEIVKGIFASLPVLNMTFRSLQEQYRSLAHQHHLERFASHPLAAAGVEVMNAVNKDLVSIESVELKNLPSDIRLVMKLENAKPFQFIFALLEGSGILGMLAGTPEPSPA